MKKHLFWILPAFIVITGICLMLNQSLTDVTQQPEKDWSRGVTIGETTVDKKLPVRVNEDGDFEIQTYEEGLVKKKTFNQTFELIDETSYDIPFDKWTQVFISDDQLIYHDYKDIRDQDGHMIVSDAKRFYPLDDTILYIKESSLYELDPAAHTSAKVMELEKNIEEIIPFQAEQTIHFMTEQSRNNDVSLQVYEWADKEAELVHDKSFQIDAMQIVDDIHFAIHDGNLAYVLETVQKQTQGSPVSYTYFTETTLGSDQDPALKPLTFHDPAGKGSLEEPDDITVSYQDGRPQLLFNAGGYTKTNYQGNQAFNVYSASMTDSGRMQTARKSNTPKISAHPQWLNESTIMWLEQEDDTKSIFVSSNNPAIIDKASGLKQDDWLRALGKTFGMLAKVLITILVSSLWFLWPVLFIVLMYVIQGRKLDEDRTWFFYTGIAVYMLAVFIFKDIIFIDAMFARAPDYLTFTGSSYVYIFAFAVVAFIAAQSTKATRDWHAPARITFFAGAHVLMLLTFFGPFYF
ncbi:hypothetical protein [Lentibacillus salicampi]|uniref:Uncharacterized protein n=1 Tax=Lentibacillus salicampi TaxID=175306 RepID=A0A4Y9A9R8_9BACI|nr:hypothetical protein [Lentibacillus salicampi]TFJ92626.1 hypothetical protein E4U82_11310 [Lentibacillus salicampi]